MTFQRKLLLIALFGTLAAVFWQELNYFKLFELNCDEPVSGMIETADDASYLSPPKNFINKGVWADNSIGLSRYFQRPPGYGIIFGTLYLFLGDHAYTGLKILQVSCFFISVILLGRILAWLGLSERNSLIVTAFYAFFPIYSGFLYFSITEGISPFLMLWSLYSFISRSRTQTFISFAAVLLVRPQLLIFPLSFLFLSLLRKDTKMIYTILLSFIPLIFWMGRNTFIAGQFVGLHPIYSDSNQSLYRPGHEALTELFRIWEYDGEHFHSIIGKVCSAGNVTEMELIRTEIPEPFRAETLPLLSEFNALYNRPDYGKTEGFKRDEQAFVSKVESVRETLIKEQSGFYYWKTPIRSAKYLLTKSQLNLFIFQDTFRGRIPMELVRVLAVLLINFGMISAFWLLLKGRNSEIRVLAFCVVAYLSYLIFFQRMNEERYLTPLLPTLLILAVCGIKSTSAILKLKKDTQQSIVPLP